MMLEAIEQKLLDSPRIVILTSRSNPSALRRTLALNEPRFGRLVRELWKSQREEITQDQAELVLRLGSLSQEVCDAWLESASAWYKDKAWQLVNATMEIAGQDIAKRINEKRKQLFSFMLTQAAIVKYMTERGGALIRELSAAQAASVNALLQHQAFIGITSPQNLARMLREMVGLLRREAIAVARLRSELVEQGVEREKIERQVARYADFLLKARAERIARTELASAYHYGQWEALRQAQESGYVDGELEKEWLTADDERLCEECEAMDGETVVDGELFSCGLPYPPLHPQCRCDVSYRIIRR